MTVKKGNVMHWNNGAANPFEQVFSLPHVLSLSLSMAQLAWGGCHWHLSKVNVGAGK